MNPYAAYLGHRDPHETIASTPGRLRSLLHTLGKEGSERSPAPGKWNAREILCHLADCEIVFAFRLRQALAQDHHIIQPFDQDRWARHYAAFNAESALAVFESVRLWNVALVRSLPADAFSKLLTHPERGDMTFQVVIETMAGHDLNHLEQLERLASASATC